jgi:hypothetical protein
LQGYIAMLLDMPSLFTLKQLIGAFIEQTANADPSQSDVR